MLTIESISKSYGDQLLLHRTGFQINPGEKIGLVGRNGHGKTTLLRMITGNEEPDDGTVRYPKEYTLGYLTQTIRFTRDTILEECCLGLPENETDDFWKAEKILAGLGFSKEDMKKSPAGFSGGYQVRLTLAKVLVASPNLLIMDEPTNYLDITSIRWISRFLASWPGEMLIVTHDRSFMDAVVTHVAGIHRQSIRKIKGDTKKYYTHIAQDEAVYEKTRVNEEKRIKEMELFITRFRAKARLAGMVQSRVKALEKMEKKASLKKIETLSFSFRQAAFSGKQILSTEELSFSYDPLTPLIDGFNLVVSPGDRIAIVGKNGKGKTTLLKLLAQKLIPEKGTLTNNPGVVPGYFEQTNIQSLNESLTVEEEILYSASDMDRQQARNICGAMMFEGDAALKSIKVLSGGEKSRVMLGKLLGQPLNLLLLDEPSNHLDMETCDTLMAALGRFNGAVVLVTHNELFLHTLANRLVVFKNNKLFVFEGSYSEFLEKEGWDEDVPIKQQGSDGLKSVSEDAPAVPRASKKEMRKRRSEIVSKRSKTLAPLQKTIDKTEHAIEEYEDKLEKLNSKIQEAVDNKDGKTIADLSRDIGRYQTKIDELFDQLEMSTDEMNEKSKIFEKQLKILER